MNPPQVYMCSPSWTILPPPSPYHPSGSSECTSPKHPVACIEPGLATRFIYDIIRISMPFSQIIPPSPSPTESKREGITDCLTCLLRNLYAGQKATVRTRLGTTDRFKTGKGVHQGCVTLLIKCIWRVHHAKCWAGWSISWNQDCWEKYQQPQICRWHCQEEKRN